MCGVVVINQSSTFIFKLDIEDKELIPVACFDDLHWFFGLQVDSLSLEELSAFSGLNERGLGSICHMELH